MWRVVISVILLAAGQCCHDISTSHDYNAWGKPNIVWQSIGIAHGYSGQWLAVVDFLGNRLNGIGSGSYCFVYLLACWLLLGFSPSLLRVLFLYPRMAPCSSRIRKASMDTIWVVLPSLNRTMFFFPYLVLLPCLVRTLSICMRLRIWSMLPSDCLHAWGLGFGLCFLAELSTHVYDIPYLGNWHIPPYSSSSSSD